MDTKRFSLVDGLFFLVWAVPLVYLACVYSTLPARVPLHFDGEGRPNRFGSPLEFLWTIVLLQVVSLGLYFLVRFLPEIDPKKKIKYSRQVLAQLSYALVTFLSALAVFLIYVSLKGHMALDLHYLFAGISLLLAYLGNLFNNIKPNYFVGIRTPWTLENETVWRRTHQLGGRLWLAGGLILAIACLLLPQRLATAVFAAGVAVLVLAPVVYSYFEFKKVAG